MKDDYLTPEEEKEVTDLVLSRGIDLESSNTRVSELEETLKEMITEFGGDETRIVPALEYVLGKRDLSFESISDKGASSKKRAIENLRNSLISVNDAIMGMYPEIFSYEEIYIPSNLFDGHSYRIYLRKHSPDYQILRKNHETKNSTLEIDFRDESPGNNETLSNITIYDDLLIEDTLLARLIKKLELFATIDFKTRHKYEISLKIHGNPRTLENVFDFLSPNDKRHKKIIQGLTELPKAVKKYIEKKSDYYDSFSFEEI
ncbi:MAG: hypothetical protein ACLFUO_05595 [Candidatus Woesearchaeota archaeon]